MNPQDQNQYPNQQPPPAGYPGGVPPQPGPQIYGPQQYTPMPVTDSGIPGQTPKKSKKKLIIAAIVLGALLLVSIIIFILMSVLGGNGGQNGGGISRAYNSPVGLAPGMQSTDVQSGKFKLTASYITGGDFTREGTFSVEDGHMYFDMVTDHERVNGLMRSLYNRQGAKVPFDVDKHGVDRTLTYDFSSILGYHYLYDQKGGEMSGFIPAVEAAKSAAKPSKLFTLTTSCDAALADVEQQIDMNTTDLTFELREVGVNKMEANVSFSALQAIDKSVVAFFDSCYDLERPAAAKLKKFVDSRRADVTKSPNFTFWQEDGVNHLEISAPAKDTPFGGTFHFELSGLNSSPAKHQGGVGSYVERRNQFGLAYSLCRVEPVVTTTLGAGYRFLREDPAYRYPSVSDTGYYCTTLTVPSQFRPIGSVALRTTTGAKATITGSAVSGLRGFHDLAYEIEQYNINNKRYPGPTEFRDLANSNMASLTSVTQAAFARQTLVYTPSPAGCVGTCNDFVLSFVPAPNVQVQRTTYRP
jgi:hypothetical protein